MNDEAAINPCFVGFHNSENLVAYHELFTCPFDECGDSYKVRDSARSGDQYFSCLDLKIPLRLLFSRKRLVLDFPVASR